jgi:hypothetical protein
MKTKYISGDSDGGAKITLLEARANGTNLGSEATFPGVKTTTDWTKYSNVFTTKAETVRGHIELRIYGHNGAGTLVMDAWFTDIKLEEI